MFDLEKWVRPNILNLKPYSSARDEFQGEASVFLDANENPYNVPYNRYPDPMQWALKKKIAAIKGVEPRRIFLGVGSDECIDVLYRAFCEPGRDNVVAIDRTVVVKIKGRKKRRVRRHKVNRALLHAFEKIPKLRKRLQGAF